MNLVRNLNIRKDELLKTVYSLAGNDKAGALQLKIIYALNNDEWKFLIGTCRPVNKADEDRVIRYRDYAFVSRAAEKVSYGDFLKQVYEEGFEVAKGLPKIEFEENTNWCQEDIVPSHLTSKQFPARRFAADIEKNSYFRETKLIGFDQDYYPSAREYIKKFIDLETFHGDQDARKGEFHIEVTDYRGRIVIDNGEISIDPPKDDFCVVGQSAEDDVVKLRGTDRVSLNQSDLEDLELWMLKEDNEVIDFRSASERAYRDIREEAVEDYLSIIQRGESEHTEFKPFIGLKNRNDHKKDELRKAVCALSNHEGGRVFLGVSDDLEILGFDDKKFRTDYSGDFDVAVGQYIKDLKKFLRESLQYNQCFEVESVIIATKPVIVITVQRTQKVNCLNHNSQAYIRKSASSPKMTPEEIQLKASQKTGFI